jgi:hypothetical protein
MDELAKALTEYYDPRTEIVRKQHLHDQLHCFLLDKNSWQLAVSVIQQQQQETATVLSPLTLYFLFQVFEHSIRHRYVDLVQLRPILLWSFVQLYDVIPMYVRSKGAFLLVQLTRCDYQHPIEEHFQTCYHVWLVCLEGE